MGRSGCSTNFSLITALTLIERCRLKAAQRAHPESLGNESAHGIPLFLDQIIKTLQVEGRPPNRCKVAESPDRQAVEIQRCRRSGWAARRHGHELLQHGYSVERVVHDYGDLCQAITDLAFDDGEAIQVDEFRTLNRCLDNAIADSVTEFAYERDLEVANRAANEFHEHLGDFAHELRNLITTATHTVSAIRTGKVGLSGPTGAVLDRCLIGLRNLVDQLPGGGALGDPDSRVGGRLLSLADFIADIEVSATLEAQAHHCALMLSAVDPRLAVEADQDMLFSAVGNLLQNAFKFTAPHTEVRSLNAYATADRILIDVEDNCGGLPPGDPEHLFRPFTQGGEDRAGVGLGLSICRRSVEANHGELSVRDVPGKGCVFTIELRRQSLN